MNGDTELGSYRVRLGIVFGFEQIAESLAPLFHSSEPLLAILFDESIDVLLSFTPNLANLFRVLKVHVSRKQTNAIVPR